jgi:hypothetical protein
LLKNSRFVSGHRFSDAGAAPAQKSFAEPPHPAHGFILSEFHESVSHLPIKPPKSLTNKDFTSKPLFLKDLEKISP